MNDRTQMIYDWKILRKDGISAMLIELSKYDEYFLQLKGTTIEGWIDIMTTNWHHICHLQSVRIFIPFICNYFPEKVEYLNIGQ